MKKIVRAVSLMLLLTVLFFLHLIRISVLQRRHAGMLFHKLPEEGRIDKIEVVGYLLDALVRMFQFVLDLFHGVLVDDSQGPFPLIFLTTVDRCLAV